ncbi:Nucleotidyltransferase domain-containing protein [Anaerovirgula multivorans]|uniref:Nucleotidyltransferase domain-containing protein n=1 Tax=Anaerovirgula multivorans TaxID=312168 RepID=A0A239EI08_9FIRM|nr:nucleotidyltransferase domain-containing protein [Anaerovirgula multivorans]SNS44257.1 Nucleotidyltransferase domain-containing protein [Anaerovirgula multivorans]
MLNQDKHIYEVENIKKQIIRRYKPHKIILFGSLAKGVIKKNSDIDICIVKDTEDKRSLISDIYINIDSTCPFDVIVYTLKEWEDNIKDNTSFAYNIFEEGKLLYGRYC